MIDFNIKIAALPLFQFKSSNLEKRLKLRSNSLIISSPSNNETHWHYNATTSPNSKIPKKMHFLIFSVKSFSRKKFRENDFTENTTSTHRYLFFHHYFSFFKRTVIPDGWTLFLKLLIDCTSFNWGAKNNPKMWRLMTIIRYLKPFLYIGDGYLHT